ncbi:MAG: hypothetical protein AAF490_11560 [Chloroflexota bacterium]
MAFEIGRESRLKSFGALAVFWLLAVVGVALTVLFTNQSGQFNTNYFNPTNFQNYLIWTLILLIPVYASLRVYSQWTFQMGFKMRLLMGLFCGCATALVIEAFVGSWLGGMSQMVGFQTIWGWPVCVMGAFLMAPFRFDRETAVSTFVIFLAAVVSMLVLF